MNFFWNGNIIFFFNSPMFSNFRKEIFLRIMNVFFENYSKAFK